MDLTAQKGELVAALRRASDLAPSKALSPILTHALVSADQGGIVRVGATDLVVSCETALPATVTQPGSVAIPARDLAARVSAMPDGEVRIAVDEKLAVTVKASGRLKYRLYGLPGADYPNIPVPPDGAVHFELPAAAVARVIRRTAYAMSGDGSRPHIHALLLEPRDGILRAVATDGHRMVIADETVTGLQATSSLLLPTRAAAALSTAATEAETMSLDCSSDGRHLFVAVGKTRIAAQLVGLDFIPYESCTPPTNGDGIVVSREAFRVAVSNVALAADRQERGVILTTTADSIRISAESHEGNAEDEVSANCGDKRIKMGMSSKNMLETLRSLDCDEVRMWIGTDDREPETSAMVIRIAGDEAAMTAVLMPMRP